MYVDAHSRIFKDKTDLNISPHHLAFVKFVSWVVVIVFPLHVHQFVVWSACRSGENWSVEVWIRLWDGKFLLQINRSQPCKYLDGHPKCTDKWARVFQLTMFKNYGEYRLIRGYYWAYKRGIVQYFSMKIDITCSINECRSLDGICQLGWIAFVFYFFHDAWCKCLSCKFQSKSLHIVS